MLQKIRNYFSAAASAQRQRDHERAALASELRTLPTHGAYAEAREGFIQRRLREIGKEDAAAALVAAGAPERRKRFHLVEPAPDYVEAGEMRRQGVLPADLAAWLSRNGATDPNVTLVTDGAIYGTADFNGARHAFKIIPSRTDGTIYVAGGLHGERHALKIAPASRPDDDEALPDWLAGVAS